jgi:phage repressor protein C with HTH and peptisase S24 domain
VPDQRKMAALAEKLELDPALLVRLASIPPSGAAPAAMMSPVPTPPGRPDIPVWASAEAGSDGAMVLVNDPIDWIRRSERMQGVKAPFAFYVIGTSMSPAIEHGDQVVVNPSLLPAAGKDHVFLQTQDDGTILALVKRLLRVGPTTWRVRQFNPPRDFELPKAKWAKALMISEKRVG